MLHFDERLIHEGWGFEDLSKLVDSIKKETNKKIVITTSKKVDSLRGYFKKEICFGKGSNYLMNLYSNYKIQDGVFKKISEVTEDIVLINSPEIRYWSELIKNSQLVISRDSACVHIASAHKKPVVDIFADKALGFVDEVWHPWQVPYRCVSYRDNAPVSEICSAVQELL